MISHGDRILRCLVKYLPFRLKVIRSVDNEVGTLVGLSNLDVTSPDDFIVHVRFSSEVKELRLFEIRLLLKPGDAKAVQLLREDFVYKHDLKFRYLDYSLWVNNCQCFELSPNSDTPSPLTIDLKMFSLFEESLLKNHVDIFELIELGYVKQLD